MRLPGTATALALAVALLAIGSIAPASQDPAWVRLVGTAPTGGTVLTPAQAADLPPTIQGGIGPGSALRMGVNGIQSVCTAAFLLRDPTTARYYLATAGHCIVRDAEDETPVTGATHPAMTLDRVDICIDGCMNNGLALGTYVSLRASDGEHPVAFAISGGVGRDFGLVALPPELHAHLRPELPQWGGPSDVARSGIQIGDLVAHYGHGTLLVPGVAAFVTRTPVDQARLASLVSNDNDAFEALGHVTGGDSGSGAALADPDPAGLAQGTQALGVITHSIVYVGAPLFSGTRLTRGLELALGHAGLALELVPEGDPLPKAPDPAAVRTVQVNVTTPAPGEAIALSTRTVTVRGTAEAAGGLPAGSAVQLAVDDPSFGTASRVPVSGNTSWRGSWDLAGVPEGQHTLRARLVDADGTVLDQENVTVTLTKSASGSGTASAAPRPGHPPTNDASDSSSTSSGGSTDGFGLSSAKPTPSAPAAAGLALLAVLAALRRRA